MESRQSNKSTISIWPAGIVNSQSRPASSSLCLVAATLLFCALSNGIASVAADKEVKAETKKTSEWPPAQERISQDYAARILDRVDQLVSKELYSEDLSKKVWPEALQKHKQKILASKNLQQLSASINEAIKELHSSHCEFSTDNDEIFYFLHSLFGSFNRHLNIAPMDFTGIVTGGPGCTFDQVRYVLDDSPGAKGGVEVGDHILSVDDKPYFGQANYYDKAKKAVRLSVNRSGKTMNVTITPEKKQDFKGYLEAMKKSAKIIHSPDGELGYIHVWCGGSKKVLEEALSDKLKDTDGLILDLRDGYGGNAIEDLDFFYRPAVAYPDFVTTMRDGKTKSERDYYDKPLVAIINRGARSGKELVAFSLKRSHRGVLVGEPTAGAVLAGRLFPIDRRTALYLAIQDVTAAGTRLEANPVEPDVSIPQPVCDPATKEKQLDAAKSELIKLIKNAKNK